MNNQTLTVITRDSHLFHLPLDGQPFMDLGDLLAGMFWGYEGDLEGSRWI